MTKNGQPVQRADWRENLHTIIFEAETPGGKVFDVLLLSSIVLSLMAIILGSVERVHSAYGDLLIQIEWVFTVLFTIEYVLRIICVKRPSQYVRSFYGIVDLLAVLPTYLAFFVGGTQSFLVVRSIRLLRMFRIFKLARYSSEAEVLMQAIRASSRKIIIFISAGITIAVIMGSVMHLIEGPQNGFEDIPSSMYWAIVTMTTVGYGDIVPQTVLGKMVASLIMILGYGMIAVPTGIVSVELAHASRLSISTRTCPVCSREGHDLDALCCRFCGERL
jgi:voltage-gated potassium channel